MFVHFSFVPNMFLSTIILFLLIYNFFPYNRGVKATLWEGGVRGVGFITSPLLKNSGYVSNHMLHVCDWLPTLYEAAGGDTAIMKKLDGQSEWKSLTENKPGKRKEILHNIDPTGKGHSALRIGDYKILVGDVGMSWDDWYPPWQNPTDSVELHVNNTQRYGHLPHKYALSYEQALQKNVKHFSMMMENNMGGEFDLDDDDELLRFYSSKQLTLRSNQMSQNYYHNNEPVKVDCGPKPMNASTNCDPRVSPCLYHIPSDPCEYNNIAASNKDLVVQMLTKLIEYENTMVPKLNTPVDPLGNPKYHDGAWVPWVKL